MEEKLTGYCVRCRTKRDIVEANIVEGKRRVAKGKCPICGTKMCIFLKKKEG